MSPHFCVFPILKDQVCPGIGSMNRGVCGLSVCVIKMVILGRCVLSGRLKNSKLPHSLPPERSLNLEKAIFHLLTSFCVERGIQRNLPHCCPPEKSRGLGAAAPFPVLQPLGNMASFEPHEQHWGLPLSPPKQPQSLEVQPF